MGSEPNDVCAAIVIATDASARANSIIAVAKATISNPEPPYSSGIKMPMRPNSPILFTRAVGNSPCSSRSRATGVISVSANSRTILRIIICSSVKNNLSIEKVFYFKGVKFEFTTRVIQSKTIEYLWHLVELILFLSIHLSLQCMRYLQELPK